VFILEFERRRRHWTQRQLCLLTDVAQPTISMIERGRYLPTPDQLARLALALDVLPDVLLRPIVPVTTPITPLPTVSEHA
jgi:transcriptional regulator with XRE-family HTH domain